MARLAKIFTPKTISRRRGWLLVCGMVLFVYVAAYVVLSAFGGWGQTGSGKLRIRYPDYVGFAIHDCFVWQPIIGDCQLFVNSSGENTLRGDAFGYMFCPLILLDQRFVHRTIYFMDPNGNNIESAKEPPLTDFHPIPAAHPFSVVPKQPLKKPSLRLISVFLISLLFIYALVFYKFRPERKPKPAKANP